MSLDNRRRHTRVPIKTTVDVLFKDHQYLNCATRDLCLSGVWIMDGQERRLGDQCEIIFHDTGITQNRMMSLRGQVARVNDQGMALLFTDMNIMTYTNLQSVLLDNADNPFEVAEEFIDRLPADQ